jgi:general secretion pathway protein K
VDHKNSSLKTLKGQKGVALLMTLVALMIMVFLAIEISYDTAVEYKSATQQVNELKAYYAAKSGVELSLYRIFMYKQAAKQFKSLLGENSSLLEMIWQFPFMWPPMVPPDLNAIDKDTIQKSISESSFDTQYITTIESEGKRIDLNDLGSLSETLAESTRKQLIQIIENRLNQDDQWARDNRNVIRAEEIINNIADYVDENTESKNGTSEESPYSDVRDAKMPPNRPLKTLEELHVVAGVTDEIFKLLLPHITVYGIKGVNVNSATKEILKSIDPLINDDKAKEILDRIASQEKGGPFKDENDFKNFVVGNSDPNKFNTTKIPLYFGSEMNFRIKSTGSSGRVSRQIVAIVYDFDTVKDRLKTIMATPTPTPTTGQQPTGATPTVTPTASPTPTTEPASKAPARPTVVYWFEN